MRADVTAAFDEGPAFIPYLVAGDTGRVGEDIDPERAAATTATFVDALVAGGADMVELGLPFSEPIAEGPTIQRASVRALESGMTPSRFFDLTASLSVDVPLVVMTYYNLIYRFGGEPGVDAFVQRAAESGIDGIIVPDLPVEESGPIHAACEQADVALIIIAAPTTRDDRLARIMEMVSGFLYVQARLGTTGSRADVSDHTRKSLERIDRFEKSASREPIPKAVGFGISTGDHAEDIVAAGADGVIVGSAVVDIVAAGGGSDDVVAQNLERKAQEITSGARRGMDRRAPGPERP